MTDDQYNATIEAVAKQLREAGLKVQTEVPANGTRFMSVSIETGVKSEPLMTLRHMSSMERVGFGRYEHNLTGFTVRWDFLGGRARGMGVSRFPLRKDGTIDAERLKADLADFKQRKERKADETATVAANQRALSKDYVQAARAAEALCGGGLTARVDNDGRTAGHLKLTVNAFLPADRIHAILAAIAATTQPAKEAP